MAARLSLTIHAAIGYVVVLSDELDTQMTLIGKYKLRCIELSARHASSKPNETKESSRAQQDCNERHVDCRCLMLNLDESGELSLFEIIRGCTLTTDVNGDSIGIV